MQGAKKVIITLFKFLHEPLIHSYILRRAKHKAIKILNKIPIIDPGHFLKLLWDVFLFLITGVYIFYIPFQMCFEDIEKNFLNSLYVYGFYFFDIFLQTNTAYFERGEMVLSRSKIIKSYLRKNFSYDLISILPSIILDSINLSGQNNYKYGSDGHLIVNLIKHSFMLKLVTINKTYERIRRDIIRNDRVNQFIDIMRVLLLSLYYSHLFACLW